MNRFEPGVGTAQREAVLAAVARLQAGGGTGAGVVVKTRRLLRCVARLDLPGGRGAYLKVHHLPRTKDRLRYLLRALPSVAERAAMDLVARAGIRCPEPLGHGGRRTLVVPREAWIATWEVPGSPVSGDSLAGALAVAERLAAAGLHHPDMHPDNLLRGAGGELWLLDMQSVRVASRRDQALASMRARCCLGFAILLGASVESVVAEGVRSQKIPPGELRRTVGLALRSHGRWLISRARRNLVESTGYTVSGTLRRTALARGFRPPAVTARGVREPVAGMACEASRTADPGVLAVDGPRALAAAWTGDLWRTLTTHEPPRLLGCERSMLTGRTRVYIHAAHDEWLGILEKDLEACTELRRFEREISSMKDLSPLVTPLLSAGYNPARSAPTSPEGLERIGGPARRMTKHDDDA